MVIEIRIDRLYTENRARNERCVCVIFSLDVPHRRLCGSKVMSVCVRHSLVEIVQMSE